MDATIEPKKTPDESFVEDAGEDVVVDRTAERRLLRKLDTVVLPLMGVSYFFGYLDRGQIGNARLLGFQEALHISNHQYFQALMIFYVGFLAVQFPTGLLMKVVPAQWVFGGAVLLFGGSAALIAAIRSFAPLMVLRLLLGFGEATLSLSFLYLSMWYKPQELATRIGLVYCSTAAAGFTSGLVAYGVGKHLNGAHGLEAWQWLFIVEGVPTVALGMAVILIMPSMPDRVVKTGHWLFRNPEEHKLLLNRTRAAQNTIDAKIVPRQIIIGLKDFKLWLGALIIAAPALGVTAFSLFLPTFVRALGFDLLTSQLYTIIPYSFAIISTPLCSYLADRYKMLAIPFAGCLLTSIIGFIIILSTANKTASIAGCCFVAAGAYPSITIGGAWITTIHGGYTKRAIAGGMAQVFVQSYSIIGTQIYDQPPRFFKGHGILLGFYMISLAGTTILYFWLKRENARKEDEAEMRRTGQAPELVNIGDFEDLCDYHPDWRYPI